MQHTGKIDNTMLININSLHIIFLTQLVHSTSEMSYQQTRLSSVQTGANRAATAGLAVCTELITKLHD